MGAHDQLSHDRATAWRAALLYQLNGLRGTDAVTHSPQPAVALLGFDCCACALRAAVPITRFNTLYWSTYPKPWYEYYRVHGYLTVDPVLQFRQCCVKPVLRSDIATTDVRFWADARQHRLNHGWSHTIRNRTGIFDTLSLMRRTTPITEDELAVNKPEMI